MKKHSIKAYAPEENGSNFFLVSFLSTTILLIQGCVGPDANAFNGNIELNREKICLSPYYVAGPAPGLDPSGFEPTSSNIARAATLQLEKLEKGQDGVLARSWEGCLLGVFPLPAPSFRMWKPALELKEVNPSSASSGPPRQR